MDHSKLKDRISVSGEEAGLHFLLSVHTELSEGAVMERAGERGIRLVPLSSYFYGEVREENIYVMNFSSIDIDRADEIMERLYQSFGN